MNKIVLTLMFCMLLVLPLISAADKLIPVEIPVSVDFTGERDFRLLLPNGFERHFYWENGTRHSDTTFTHVVYETIDCDQICESTEAAQKYEDINGHLINMVDVCANMVKKMNNTEYVKTLIEDREQCESDHAILGNSFDTCETAKIGYKEELDSCEADYKNDKNKLDTCTSQLTNYKNEVKDFNIVKEDLKEAESNQMTYFIVGAIIATGICWYMWKRKPGEGPREMQDAYEYR